MTADYSFVIPILNECETLEELYARLAPVLDALDGPIEVILVDDGSTDGSYEIMLGLQQRDSRFRILRLSRNFGHQIAITAGLDHARGNAAIVMDASRPQQQVWRGTLDDLARETADVDGDGPGTLVIGDVVAIGTQQELVAQAFRPAQGRG